MKETNKKVFVAMSGGVDSSVAAALLLKTGKYEVVGVYCVGWTPEGMACGWKNERRDAVRVAAKLGIPFLTFDFSREYKKKVVEYMKKEYTSSRTPNPDVMCNKYIKFGMFLDKALKMGADYIATGHYVRPTSPTKAKPLLDNKGLAFVKLLQARDKNKDQSYFLWTLTQKQLKYCLFPIGDYTKPKVRKMAQKFDLHNAQKGDSQGLCFVGNINFLAFLRKMIPQKTGLVKMANGEIVGRHDGVHFYTIGQRHGLNIPGGPYYIVDKDSENNVLIVAKGKEEKFFYKKEVLITDTNWISGFPDLKNKYSGRIRYRQSLQRCRLQFIRRKFQVLFEKPQRAVTSGQSLVLYDGKKMLGGGIIV